MRGTSLTTGNETRTTTRCTQLLGRTGSHERGRDQWGKELEVICMGGGGWGEVEAVRADSGAALEVRSR